jgi:hypothetical protein
MIRAFGPIMDQKHTFFPGFLSDDDRYVPILLDEGKSREDIGYFERV